MTSTPWIQNVSYKDIQDGTHYGDGANTIYIQVVDPAYEFPIPKLTYDESHRFEFLDAEDSDAEKFGEEFLISDVQAAQLVSILQHALSNDKNVICACHAGVCRSGAIAEVGVMLGFKDTNTFRSPNLRVKHKMMRCLGWTYDTDEKPQDNWQAYYDYLESKGDI